MGEDSKTLLKKFVSKERYGENIAERTRYSVIANRLVAMGGISSNYIYAEKFNKGDYLIINYRNFDDDKQPLEIVNDRHNLKTVLDTLYEQALEVANERARLDGNSVLDLTGNVPIPEEAKYYK